MRRANKVGGPKSGQDGTKQPSSSLSDRGKGDREGGSTAKKPVSATATAAHIPAAPPKIVSRLQRQQTEAKRRIETENKAMQGRIKSHGPKSAAARVGGVYGKPVIPVAVPTAEPKTATENVEKRSRQASVSASAKDSKPPMSSETLEELMKQVTLAKKEVADLESENQVLRANLSKVKVTSQQYETSSSRIRKRVGGVAGGMIDGGGEEGERSVSEVCGKYVPTIIRNEEEEQADLDQIDDPELKELVMEYYALQEMRRGLIERIRSANHAVRRAVQVREKETADLSLLRSRLGLLAPSVFNPGGSPLSTEEQEMKGVYEQLSRTQLEFKLAEASLEHKFHVGPLLDAIQEDKVVIAMMKKKIHDVDDEMMRIDREENQVREQLRTIRSERTVEKLRDSVYRLRVEYSEMKNKKEMSTFLAEAAEFEKKWNL